MTLYTYCIPVDDGAAPNPYWGLCSLTICKPAIRRTAAVGDWVVGIGSKNSPIGDISSCVVYAMRVSQIMSMTDYDAYCRKSLSDKVPDWSNHDVRRRVGDCIYDFGTNPPSVRPSVHSTKNRAHDLRGVNALLSDHFFYFGNRPVQLPPSLISIIKSGRGHRSKANDAYVAQFLSWLSNLGHSPGAIIGSPQVTIEAGCKTGCSSSRSEEDEEVESCG